MKKKKIAIILAVLAAAALTTFLVFRPSEFLHSGTIEATKVDVPARVTSVIGAFEVKEGERVAAGQTLVRLSGEDLKLAADAVAADYERAQRLFRAGSMPRETFEHLKTRRDEALLRWNWCTITAPAAGTVLTTYREKGEWVSPGTKLLTLADLSEVWAMIYVEQPFLTKLSLGQKVSGELAEMPGRVFEGRIVRLAEEAEFTPKNVQTRQERARLVYGVKVSFPNADGILKPGMPIEVRLPQ